MSRSVEIQLAGYGVVRVCALPASVLAGLGSPKLAELVDELAELDHAWRAAAPRLAEQLTDLVPLVADRKRRSMVLGLRRRLHRADSLTPAEITALVAAVTDHSCVDAAALGELAGQREELRHRLDAEYEAAWSAEQRLLAQLAAERVIRASAQLTADGLLHNVDRYVAAVGAGAARDKRSRTTETTVVNLVTRSALKPSPFGQLVHTRPLRLGGAGVNTPTRPGSVCRLPRQLVSWVERTVAAHPALRGRVVLRRAPVVSLSPQAVSFLVRGRDGTAEPPARERILKVSRDAVSDTLLESPADHPMTEDDVLRRCAERDPAGRAAHAGRLAELSRTGVVADDLGVGEQAADPLGALVDLLPPDCPPALRDGLTSLRDIEAEFGSAPPERRVTLLAEVRAGVAGLAELCGVGLPPLELARTLVYEDVVDPRPLVEPPDRWAPHRDTLGLLHRLVPLFDDDAHVRAIVADVVQSLFGPGPHRLLPLYTALSSAKAKAVLAERLIDLDGPVPRALRQAQGRVLAEAEPLGEEISLDPDRLRAMAGQAPRWVSRWPRVSWHIQRCPAGGRDSLVVNAGAIGFGRTISRFCAGYSAAGPDGVRFTDAVRGELADPPDSPVVSVDLAAVLGINGNVHPPLLGEYLRYPCGTAGGWPGTGISIEDCWATVDDGRLVLTAGRTGPRLRLVPLNFLLNDLAPQFYRFLSFFALGALANFAWWDRVDQRQDSRRGVRRYPRIRIGGVVVARRTWKVPTEHLPEGSATDGLAGYRAIRRWQHELDLPDLVFSRLFTLPDPLVPLDPAERERKARSLARFPSSAERKPVLVDFTSVTSVRAWQRSLRRADDDLTIQECLPLPGSEAADGSGVQHTREFVLETVGPDDV